jgi:HSP20 family protein
MLNIYRNTNEWPTFVPFALFDSPEFGRNFSHLRQDLDRVFGRYERSLNSPFVQPNEIAELCDTGSDLVVTIDLPGVSKKDVELTISGDNVFIRATRTLTAKEGYTAHRRERSSFNFEHAFQLPVAVESKTTVAHLQDGVLTVTLPKSPNAQPKQITVKAG